MDVIASSSKQPATPRLSRYDKRRAAMLLWLCGGTALLSAAPATAQDRNQEIMKALYTKIENQLGVSSTGGGLTSGALVLAQPGYIIDKNLNYQRADQRRVLFDLIDSSLQPNWILRFSPYSTSSIYRAVLSSHVAAPASLSGPEKQKLIEARKILYKPGPNNPWSKTYLEWDDARTKYYAAQDSMTSWQDAHGDDTPPASMLLKLQQAHDLFFNGPHYSEVVAALDTMTTLGSRDPAVFWGTLNSQYTFNSTPVGGTSVANYEFYPKYNEWIDNSQNWTKITLSDADLTSFQSSSHTSWGGGLSGGWGLWSGGGSYGKSEGRTVQSLDTKSFQLTFEILRVRIMRPWMDPSIFGARTWDWSSSSPYRSRTISDGESTTAATPTGLEPMVAEELILARNISLTGNWGTDLATTYHSESHASGHVGWGPFSFGGSSSSTYDEATDHNQVTSNGITSPDVQIIGMLVSVRPRTPYPDPTLFGSGTPATVSALAAPLTNLLPGAAQLPSQRDLTYNRQYQRIVGRGQNSNK